MSEHTPGPWKWAGNGIESDCIDGPAYGQVMDAYVTCGQYCYGGKVEIDIGEDDARLIAAAPELLEASERVVQWFKDNGQKLPFDSAPDCVRCLDEAIAKARGRG